MANATSPSDEAVSTRLDSWKEIAAYLKREVRTVRRWEKSEGLPVHRHVHNRQSTVYAYRAELDAWLAERRSTPGLAESSPRRPLLWVGALVICIVVVLASMLVVWHPPASGTGSQRMDTAIHSRLFARATAEDAQIQWIPVGEYPGIAFLKPGGAEVYVGSPESIAVIDTASNQVKRTIAIPKSQTMRMAQDGGTLYVGTEQGALLFIDTASWQVRSVQTGASVIRDIAPTRDNSKVYLACEFSGLKCLRTRTLDISTVRTVACPTALALSPDDKRLYVNYQCEGPGGSPGHDAIGVVDVATNRFLDTITGLPNVGGYTAVTPDGTQVWAGAGDACSTTRYDHVGCPVVPSSLVNVIRTDGHRLLRSLSFPVEDVSGISFFSEGSRAVIGGKNLKVVDTTTLTEVEQLPLESQTVVFLPDARRAYVPAFRKNAVAVLELGPKDCLPPPQGLTSWWPGDGNANDVRAGSHGEPQNGATFAPGLAGQAFRLDGIDYVVRVSRVANLSSASREMTLALWVKFADQARVAPIFLLHGRPDVGQPDDGLAVFRSADGRFVFRWGRTEVTGRTRAEAGKWYLVLAEKAGDHISLYVDGVPEGEARLGPSPEWEFVELRMGAQRNRDYFRGLLDEVQLYKRALTDTEIAALSRSGHSGLCYQ